MRKAAFLLADYFATGAICRNCMCPCKGYYKIIPILCARFPKLTCGFWIAQNLCFMPPPAKNIPSEPKNILSKPKNIPSEPKKIPYLKKAAFSIISLSKRHGKTKNDREVWQ